jgi:predicted DsbA family dithiol-disulfide isomerase
MAIGVEREPGETTAWRTPAVTHSSTRVAQNVAAADTAATIRPTLRTSVVEVSTGPSIEIWSDLVCPWCAIGKRRFERAITALADEWEVDAAEHFEVRYLPFQLDPTARGPQPVLDVYRAKFGSQAPAIIERVTAVAAAEGLEFNFDRAVRANTLDAHRLLWWAEDPSVDLDQSTLNESIMRAYFTDGLDIADHRVLTDCAGTLGADTDIVSAFLASNAGHREVTELIASATSKQITAVPTYVIDGSWSIPGAQDVDVFIQVLRRMAERRR